VRDLVSTINVSLSRIQPAVRQWRLAAPAGRRRARYNDVRCLRSATWTLSPERADGGTGSTLRSYVVTVGAANRNEDPRPGRRRRRRMVGERHTRASSCFAPGRWGIFSP